METTKLFISSSCLYAARFYSNWDKDQGWCCACCRKTYHISIVGILLSVELIMAYIEFLALLALDLLFYKNVEPEDIFEYEFAI